MASRSQIGDGDDEIETRVTRLARRCYVTRVLQIRNEETKCARGADAALTA